MTETDVVDIERRTSENREVLSDDIKSEIRGMTMKALTNDLPHRALGAMEQLDRSKALASYVEVASVQRDFALALNVMRQLDVKDKYHKIINSVLEKNSRLKEFLFGPVSALTLSDLGRGCRMESPPSMDDLLANPELDAKSGLDFVQYAGQVDGKRVINLVQIKTTSEGYVDIMEIDGDHDDYLGVKSGDAHKLSGLASRLNDNKKYDDDTIYRAYVVLVPAYDSNRIDNVYGIIKDETLYDEFAEVAQKTGYFLPRKDES